jgi:hypothetical protein
MVFDDIFQIIIVPGLAAVWCIQRLEQSTAMGEERREGDVTERGRTQQATDNIPKGENFEISEGAVHGQAWSSRLGYDRQAFNQDDGNPDAICALQ